MLSALWPKSNRQVSRLGFGAMGLCGCFEAVTQRELVRSVLHSLEKGVNFIDTARGYGQSEELLGLALGEWSGDRPFVATKAESKGRDNSRWGIPPSAEETFPRGSITRDCETSLRLLGLEQLDLLQLHLYWPTWGTRGYWLDELLTLKEQGKVAFIGVSAPDHRPDAVLPLVQTGLIDSVQVICNIFDPLALDCLVPIAQAQNVAIIARCVLDEGGLTGSLTKDTVFDDGDFRKTFFEAVPRETYIGKVDQLRRFVPDHASTLAALAIKFSVHHPGVTTAIASMHVTRFADQNIAALDEPPLSASVFEELRRKHRWVRNFYTTKYWA